MQRPAAPGWKLCRCCDTLGRPGAQRQYAYGKERSDLHSLPVGSSLPGTKTVCNPFFFLSSRVATALFSLHGRRGVDGKTNERLGSGKGWVSECVYVYVYVSLYMCACADI